MSARGASRWLARLMGVAGVLCATAACRPPAPVVTAPPTATAATVTRLALDMRRPLPVGTAQRLNSITGLRSWVLREGDGVTPQPGQTVEVAYAGFMTDGSAVDSSLRRGHPATFTLGSGAVIPGWEEAVASMRVGELRKIEIPPQLGYGVDGGGVMPPGTTLIFDLELLSVK